jgi:uncharacterized protein YndB with AHSA1/START domain
MKVLLKLLGGLAVLVLLAAAVSFFFPKTYRVERSTVINARPDVVFGQLGDLKAWKNWTAWHDRDPAMTLTYSEKTTGVGAWSAWESKSEGNGKMTITAVEPPRKLVYTLEFPDMNMVSSGGMELQPANTGVRVVWYSEGDLGMNPINRWFGLFLDKMIGADFERGLAKLKTVAETAK